MRPGETFERYTIEGVLGRGGMGCVYRAHDPKLGRGVAIKVLLPGGAGIDATPTDEAKARMLREARAAAALSHPNAVSIYDVGESYANGPYIVMELISGRSLREASSDPAAPVSDKVRWLKETASALAAAHDRGIVHRDVKPENVIVRTDGVAKVLDFGIARRFDSEFDPSAPTEAPLPTLTEQGAQLGTPLYMAPEQIKGDPVDGRSDQFSWGVMAYEVFTGKLPWRIDKGQLGAAASILTDKPPPMVGTSSELETVVRRALSKDPAERFESMRALIVALDGASGDKKVPASSTTAKDVESPPKTALSPRAASGEANERGSRDAPEAPGAVEPAPRSRADRRVSGPGNSPDDSPDVPTADPRRYDTAQFKEIFQRALERQESEGRYEHDDLVAAARELGIRDDVLDATLADAELGEQRQRLSQKTEAEERHRAWRRFWRLAVSLAIGNFVLFFMVHVWNRWMLFGSIIGLAAQLRNIYLPREREERGETRREQRRRRRDERGERRRGERSVAGRDSAANRGSAPEAGSEARIEEGVRILLSRTSKRIRVPSADKSVTSSARRPRTNEAERDAVAEEADEERPARKRRR